VIDPTLILASEVTYNNGNEIIQWLYRKTIDSAISPTYGSNSLPKKDAERKDVDKDGCFEGQALILAIQGRQRGKGSIVELEIERHYMHVEGHLFLDDGDVHVVQFVDFFANLLKDSV